MSKVVDEYSLGFNLDLSDQSIKERILDSYSSYAKEKRAQGARRFMTLVESQNKETHAAIARMVSDCI